MNLTQRELASLAKVSTPTISRFEQAENDMQLSSAIAILDVLGMTDKRTLTFPDPRPSYDIWEGVTFWGQDGTTRVHCRVSREALSDHFSESDRLRPEVAFKNTKRDRSAGAPQVPSRSIGGG